MKLQPYEAVGLGGTFDHFHIGHQHFLRFASQFGKHILVGVTTPRLSEHKQCSQSIEPLEVRMQAVKQFLDQEHIHGEVFILDDAFGPTLANSQVNAVAVTEHTIAGAEAINQKRMKLGLVPLPYQVCSLLKDATDQFISSTRIRTGEINRRGEVYSQLFATALVLNQEQLHFFSIAQGSIIQEQDLLTSKKPVFSACLIGDVVTDTFLRNQLPFQLAVYDGRSQRATFRSRQIEQHTQQNPAAEIENPAGQISTDLCRWIVHYFAQQPGEQLKIVPKFLAIHGEEDLVTVALAALAPLSTPIYYGQPHQGIVELIVTETVKERFATVLKARS